MNSLLVGDAFHIDPHREDTDIDKAIFELDSFGQSFCTQNSAYGLSEVSGKVGVLEPDKVCTKNPVEQIVPNGEATEDV